MSSTGSDELARRLLHRDPSRPFLIAGPCVVESRDTAFRTAERIAALSAKYNIFAIYKSSFIKANRTSRTSFTTIGIDASLRILDDIRLAFGLPLLTDVHEYTDLAAVSSVADILQTPAFLCRQTEFLSRVAQQDKITNIKKGQFISPLEAIQVAEKFRSFGNEKIMLCERGTMFGYNYLINDFRGIQVIQQAGWPIVFDATHSVQRPGGAGSVSSGDRQYALGVARAALGVGISGVFAETHPDPETALSDGPNMICFRRLEQLVQSICGFRSFWREQGVSDFAVLSADSPRDL